MLKQKISFVTWCTPPTAKVENNNSVNKNLSMIRTRKHIITITFNTFQNYITYLEYLMTFYFKYPQWNICYKFDIETELADWKGH